MGSDSDLEIMQEAAKVLEEFKVPYEITVVSAHRTPERMFEYAKTARERGLKVIIAGAFAGHGGFHYYTSGYWCSGKIKNIGRNGLVAFNSTNARWCSCCYSCYQ
jgi:hypothetical protein